LEKFREKISQFPSATSTAILRANADVQAIKIKFAREFWLTSGKETVKLIVRAKLAEVNFLHDFVTYSGYRCFSFSSFPYIFFSFSAERGRESRGHRCIPRRVTLCEDSSESGEKNSGSGSSSSSSSDAGSDDGQSSEHEDNSPKVDVTN
jgi:hypothetical protein